MTDRGGFDLLAVGVFASPAHLGTMGEVCLREVEQGRRVGSVFLDVENADEVPVGAVLGGLMRRARLRKVRRIEGVLRSAGVAVVPAVSATRPTEEISSAAAGIDSADALQIYRFAGAALGMGCLASLINRLGDTEPDVATHRVLVDGLLSAAQQSFLLTRGLIERYRPQRILVYNGRLAASKGVTEAARLAEVGVAYCEIGATYRRFYLSGRPPQSFPNARDNLRRAWENAGDRREEIAAGFFAPDRGGAVLPFSQFLDLQERGLSIEPTQRSRIVFFVSSDDEHAAVEDGLEHPIFASQRAAVSWLIGWVGEHQDTELVIRVHPRMRKLSARERNWWESLAAPRVRVLPAEHPVDSYALAATADKVLCYRSSMGAEATYLGRVAIALGDTIYRGLDCVYEPQTVAEVERLLLDPDLAPKPKQNCLPYGYERLMKGTPYRFYQPSSDVGGTFMGTPLIGDSQSLFSVIRRFDQLLGLAREAFDRR